jgi:hypothetical protein
MDHQIYGILLFVSILLLLYLLNKNYNQSISDVIYQVDIKEGFGNNPLSTKNPIKNDNFIEYKNTYFNIDNENKIIDKTLDKLLLECENDSTCYGITKLKNSSEFFYKIKNINSCKNIYQGSDLEKDLSNNYVSYIKKSIPNYDKLCILNENSNSISSIYGYNNLVWTVKNNKIELLSNVVIDSNNDYNLCKFKIVDGLDGKNGKNKDGNETISIKYEVEGFPTRYVVNEYPNKNYLFLREVKDSELEWKKRASYKIINGFTKNGFSLKVIGFGDIYIIASGNKPNILDVLRIESSDEESKKRGTFYIKPELTKESNAAIDDSLKKINDDDTDYNISFTPEDKAKKMKTINLYTLEKQTSMLENQMKMINSYDFIHKNNISNIGREFANQSANLALSKYLEEKDNIKLSGQNSNLIVNNGLNTPSVSQFKNKL